MWATWVVAAIALAATAFMLTFLIALLREGAPSVCYWVVPVRREPKRELVEILSTTAWTTVAGRSLSCLQRSRRATGSLQSGRCAKRRLLATGSSSDQGSSHPGNPDRVLAELIGANSMQDVIFLAVTIFFFVISLAYVLFCERVR